MTQHDEALERVARAIYESNGYAYAGAMRDIHGQPMGAWRDALAAARAAVEAIFAGGGEPVATHRREAPWNEKAERDGFPSMIHWIREYRSRTGLTLKAAKDAYDSDKAMLATSPPPPETREAIEAEREACARVAEDKANTNDFRARMVIAAAIRARGQS